MLTAGNFLSFWETVTYWVNWVAMKDLTPVNQVCALNDASKLSSAFNTLGWDLITAKRKLQVHNVSTFRAHNQKIS